MQRLGRKETRTDPLVLRKAALEENLGVVGGERNAEVEIIH